MGPHTVWALECHSLQAVCVDIAGSYRKRGSSNAPLKQAGSYSKVQATPHSRCLPNLVQLFLMKKYKIIRLVPLLLP